MRENVKGKIDFSVFGSKEERGENKRSYVFSKPTKNQSPLREKTRKKEV